MSNNFCYITILLKFVKNLINIVSPFLVAHISRPIFNLYNHISYDFCLILDTLTINKWKSHDYHLRHLVFVWYVWYLVCIKIKDEAIILLHSYSKWFSIKVTVVQKTDLSRGQILVNIECSKIYYPTFITSNWLNKPIRSQKFVNTKCKYTLSREYPE